MYLNLFEKYFVYFLIPPHTETGEPEINMVIGKYQYKYKLILNNSLVDAKLSQTPDMIK